MSAQRVLDQIEEGAARPHEAGGQDYQTTLLCSVAISTKRVADQLERIADIFDQVTSSDSFAAVRTTR